MRKHGPATIRVRCTKSTHPLQWRAPGAIVVTLIHEVAHLRHSNHGVRFWRLVRHLVDQAYASGLYDPEEDDCDEGAAGDAKLVGSAADGLAEAARRRRLAHWRANRDALAQWKEGDTAIISAYRRRLPLRVTILGKRQTRAEVIDGRGCRYLAAGSLLHPVEAGTEARS